MDKDWADAINDTLGTNLAVVDDEQKEEEIVDDEKLEAERIVTDEKAGAESPTGEEADKGVETPEPDAAKPVPDDKVLEPVPLKDEPEEKFSPKEAIKEALRELESENKIDQNEREIMKKGVLDAFYPEGIDRQLRDSDGDPITGISDLTKLINPKTNDYFTDEEAGAWLLASQQKLNKEIEQLENYAAEIVDTNLSLKDGADRVEEVYGDLLKTLPDVADKVLEAYKKTLVTDPKTGIVLKAPVDVVEFYNIALSGYKQVAEQMAAKTAAEAAAAKKAADEAAKLAQAERGDLSPRGSSALPLDEDAQGWDTAMDQYYNNKK